jgi:hypothetical protein
VRLSWQSGLPNFFTSLGAHRRQDFHVGLRFFSVRFHSQIVKGVLLTLTCSNSHGQRHGRAVVVGIGNGRHIGHLRLTVRVRAGLACRGGHMKDEGGGECTH